MLEMTFQARSHVTCNSGIESIQLGRVKNINLPHKKKKKNGGCRLATSMLPSWARTRDPLINSQML